MDPIKFNYAIFDLDMTLVDSIVPLMLGANLLAREFGLPEISYEEARAVGKSLPNVTCELLWRGLWGRYEPAWHEFHRDRLAEVEYAAMRLFPGALETLETLAGQGIGLGLASNRDQPGRALAALGLSPLFKAVVGQLDVAAPKPAPDMILKALELLGAGREEALYVCDSRGDIAAAAGAGVRAFSLTTGGHTRADLEAWGAWRAGDRLSDILEFFPQGNTKRP